jgi:glycosyltransferase 2 family protein
VTLEPVRRPTRGSTVRALLGWLLGLVLLVVVLSVLDLRTTLANAATANVMFVVIAVVGLSSTHLVGAVAWREIARVLLGVRLPWKTAIGSYYVAQALGGLTPGNVGGDIYRVSIHRATGERWSSSALPVIVQRGTGLLATAVYGSIGLALLPATATVGAPLLIGGAIFGVLLGVLVLILLLGRANLATASWALLRWPFVIGLTAGLVFHALGIAFYYLLVIAVEPGAGSVPTVGAIAVARLTMAIPVSPAGLGLQEGALALLFLNLGLHPETAVAASLLGRLSLLSTTVVGVAVTFLRRRRA